MNRFSYIRLDNNSDNNNNPTTKKVKSNERVSGSKIASLALIFLALQVVVSFIFIFVRKAIIETGGDISRYNRFSDIINIKVADYLIISLAAYSISVVIAALIINYDNNKSNLSSNYTRLNHMSMLDEKKGGILSFLFPVDKVKPSQFISAVFSILLVSAAGTGITAILSIIFQFFNYIPDTLDLNPHGTLETILYFVLLSIAAPFFEEIMCRSFVVYYTRKYGVGVVMIVSGLTFALIHGNIMQAPTAFFFGLAAGYMLYTYNNIWIVITAHFVNNAFSSLISLIHNDVLAGGLYSMYIGIVIIAGIFGMLVYVLKTKPDFNDIIIKRKDAATLKKILLSPMYCVFIGVSIILTFTSMIS